MYFYLLFEILDAPQSLKFNWLCHLILLASVGPYDFRVVENADRIVESCHKNEIYCITQNVTGFAKFWKDTSKVGQYT